MLTAAKTNFTLTVEFVRAGQTTTRARALGFFGTLAGATAAMLLVAKTLEAEGCTVTGFAVKAKK